MTTLSPIKKSKHSRASLSSSMNSSNEKSFFLAPKVVKIILNENTQRKKNHLTKAKEKRASLFGKTRQINEPSNKEEILDQEEIILIDSGYHESTRIQDLDTESRLNQKPILFEFLNSKSENIKKNNFSNPSLVKPKQTNKTPLKPVTLKPFKVPKIKYEDSPLYKKVKI